jgi:ubiquinone/menaquinone biosynthesis C-methylase UbiE
LTAPLLDDFDVDHDRRVAADLAGETERLDFAALLCRYWQAQDVPPDLAERFVRGDMMGAERAAEVVTQIEHLVQPARLDDGTLLEVGCGTAALGSVLAQHARTVVVSDVSLAWLVLASVRLRECVASRVHLVACSAGALPFADGRFDLVAAADVIEHVPDPRALVDEGQRVLRQGGALWLSTPNRFSLTREPHVRLWGVGWLPRRVAVPYVRRARGVDYRPIRTLSVRRLRRLLRATGVEVRLEAPAITWPVRAEYGPGGRRAIDAYNKVRLLPLLGRLLQGIAPLFHAMVRKGSSSSRG